MTSGENMTNTVNDGTPAVGEITRSETVVFRKSDLVQSPVVDMSTPNDSQSPSSSATPSSNCEIESLRESLQQALEDKAELIEESFLDKERIRDQKETIELLTKRVREFEMSSRTTSSITSSRSSSKSMPALHSQIKQLSEDNIQLAKEVDRLVAERDKLEKKLIDMKIKLRARNNSIASTDEDDNELNVFSDYDKKRKTKMLGPNKKGGSVFAAAKNWFANKSSKSRKSSPKKSSSFSRTIAV
jgi:hypothetical protein